MLPRHALVDPRGEAAGLVDLVPGVGAAEDHACEEPSQGQLLEFGGARDLHLHELVQEVFGEAGEAFSHKQGVNTPGATSICSLAIRVDGGSTTVQRSNHGPGTIRREA